MTPVCTFGLWCILDHFSKAPGASMVEYSSEWNVYVWMLLLVERSEGDDWMACRMNESKCGLESECKTFFEIDLRRLFISSKIPMFSTLILIQNELLVQCYSRMWRLRSCCCILPTWQRVDWLILNLWWEDL